MSNTLLLPLRDLRPLLAGSVRVDGAQVVGPRLAAALERARRAALAGDPLLIHGESGAGKELVARAFHAQGPRARGPFIAANCAAIPPALAERLLFGARKGAYSGADADADGYAQAAAGGVLFLDEVGELDLAVQAKLLRLLESRELLPLGAARPKSIDLQLCCATHRNLRERVAAGHFRDDLLFRISQATVQVPALRDRPEEIPWLVDAQLARLPRPVAANARFVEQCLLRPWPGNVRELMSAVRGAAREREHDEPLRLPDGAGEALASPAGAAAARPGPPAPPPEPTRAAVEESLRAHRGNVAATARALGVQRTALYRLMKKLGVSGDRD
jgi:DNA-binding NtrC family response regulator